MITKSRIEIVYPEIKFGYAEIKIKHFRIKQAEIFSNLLKESDSLIYLN